MKGIRFIIFIGFVTLISCHNKITKDYNVNNVKKISVNPEKRIIVKRSGIWDIENIIRLDSDTAHLLSEISDVYFFKHNFIIEADDHANLYNYNGKFQIKLGNIGRGPGEYLSIKSICTKNNSFFILDRSQKKIINYSQNNIFIGEHNIDIYGQAMAIYKDNFIIYQGVEQNSYNKKLFFYNDDFDLIYTHFDIDKNTNKYMNAYEKTNFYVIHDTLCFISGFYDTVYNINIINNVHNITPRYVIDFGKYSLPKKYYQGNFSDIMQYFNTIRQNDYAFYIMGFFETNKLIMFMFNLRDNSYLVIHSKQTGKTKVIYKIIDDIFTNSKELKPLNEYFSYYNNNDESLYYFMDAYYFVKNINEIKNNTSNEEWKNYCLKHPKIINIYRSLNENDNPVIIKFRLKEF